MQKIKRIAITGPESTGKSQLSEKLARFYNTVWVNEYSREYLENLGRDYNYDDILKIAQQQYNLENNEALKANTFLFCDTDFTVTKIWCEFKYGKCHEWISEMFLKHKYDLYLLCDIDLPWIYDPLREHPDKREALFSLYKNTLEKANFNFEIISGTGDKRLNNAIKALEKHFMLNIQ